MQHNEQTNRIIKETNGVVLGQVILYSMHWQDSLFTGNEACPAYALACRSPSTVWIAPRLHEIVLVFGFFVTISSHKMYESTGSSSSQTSVCLLSNGSSSNQTSVCYFACSFRYLQCALCVIVLLVLFAICLWFTWVLPSLDARQIILYWANGLESHVLFTSSGIEKQDLVSGTRNQWLCWSLIFRSWEWALHAFRSCQQSGASPIFLSI